MIKVIMTEQVLKQIASHVDGRKTTIVAIDIENGSNKANITIHRTKQVLVAKNGLIKAYES